MHIKDLSAWHRFTYTQLYPAVLGSMLYDVLHVEAGWGPLQLIEISVAVLFCTDYFHLQGDLGADQLPKGNWRETVLDGAIAVMFGMAYWRVSDHHLASGYILLAIVGLLALVYNLAPARRSAPRVAALAVLFTLFGALALVASNVVMPTWGFAALSWIPTVWYWLYVFNLTNRFPTGGRIEAAV